MSYWRRERARVVNKEREIRSINYDKNKELRETQRKIGVYINKRPENTKTPWWLHMTEDGYYF